MPSPPMPITIHTERGGRISVASATNHPTITLATATDDGHGVLQLLTTHETAALIQALSSELSIVERSQQTAKECNHVPAHLNRPLRATNRNPKSAEAPPAKKRKSAH